MKAEDKIWIDSASYRDLFQHWRFAKIGDAMFLGDTGDYYAKRMKAMREEVGPATHTAASKSIGWDT